MEQMVPVVLTLLTEHYLPVLNTVMTSHWNISSIPVFHTASKQSRAACCLILFATWLYSVINLILSRCFVSRGTIFCVWYPDRDCRRERMGPEPSKGWEVVVRATLPSALNMMNASALGKLVQLVTASRLTYITKDELIQWRMNATTK